jgi:hypothetical protein
MPPYEARFTLGTSVRVVDRVTLEEFRRAWTWHHRLEPSQLAYADVVASVRRISYYHGGDVLYELDGAPGTWHESCLRAL